MKTLKKRTLKNVSLIFLFALVVFVSFFIISENKDKISMTGNSIYSLSGFINSLINGYVSSDVQGPTNGLVGYWTFDETSGTTASDSSGNGNTGTLTNGPTWTQGKIGG